MPKPCIGSAYWEVTHESCNDTLYWQKTVPAPVQDEVNKTTISTLDGREIGYITYPDYYIPCFSSSTSDNSNVNPVKYGYIHALLIKRPFRNQKLGVGKHLFKFVENYYRTKNIPFMRWKACPMDASPEDLKLTFEERMGRLVAYYESLGGHTIGEIGHGGIEMVSFLDPDFATSTFEQLGCQHPDQASSF